MTANLLPTLEYIAAIKEDIRDAIVSRGGNLDGIPFTQWHTVVAGLSFDTTPVDSKPVPVKPDPPLPPYIPPEIPPATVGATLENSYPQIASGSELIDMEPPFGTVISGVDVSDFWVFDFTGRNAENTIPYVSKRPLPALITVTVGQPYPFSFKSNSPVGAGLYYQDFVLSGLVAGKEFWLARIGQNMDVVLPSVVELRNADTGEFIQVFDSAAISAVAPPEHQNIANHPEYVFEQALALRKTKVAVSGQNYVVRVAAPESQLNVAGLIFLNQFDAYVAPIAPENLKWWYNNRWYSTLQEACETTIAVDDSWYNDMNYSLGLRKTSTFIEVKQGWRYKHQVLQQTPEFVDDQRYAVCWYTVAYTGPEPENNYTVTGFIELERDDAHNVV